MELIETLQNNGHEVTVVADFSDSKDYNFDFKTIDLSLQNRSKSVLKAIKYYYAIKNIIKEEKPEVVFTFMIKPNTFGAIAAQSAGAKKVYSMIEGMGTVYTNNSLKYRLIRKITDFMYKKSMRKLKGLFVLNNYDAEYFINKKFIEKDKITVIPGIGLDTAKYKFEDIRNYNRFVLIARLYKEKGVEEYCKAAEIVKQKYPEVEFLIYGYKDASMANIVDYYANKNVVKYMGITSDIPEVLQDAEVVVLPSYREGASRIIMEAMSAGRPVITYDTIGCNHLVRHNTDGLLVEYKSIEPLAQAMIQLIENHELVDKMSKEAHKYAVENFDCKVINNKILQVIEKEKD